MLLFLNYGLYLFYSRFNRLGYDKAIKGAIAYCTQERRTFYEKQTVSVL